MNETKNQLIQTGFTLDRLHQDGKIDAEAYTILKDRNKQAINYSQCCTELLCVDKELTYFTFNKTYKMISEPDIQHYVVKNDIGKDQLIFKKFFKVK